MNRKIVGKLKSRCVGPYAFVRYTGSRGVNAEVQGANSKIRVESVANLIPM